MPKIKTHRGAAKRFKVTGTKKIKRWRAYTSHLLTCKSPKRGRRLRTATLVAGNQLRQVRILLNV